jgi:hypothetical protein
VLHTVVEASAELNGGGGTGLDGNTSKDFVGEGTGGILDVGGRRRGRRRW